MSSTNPRAAYWAAMIVFALNGIAFASWASRIPTVTRILDLTAGQTGVVLLAMAAGSVVALPLAGTVASHIGTASTVRVGAAISGAGVLLMALGLALPSVMPVVIGLFLMGAGIGLWDVSQNVEGAAVERLLGRTVMPQFHGAFSGGALLGALIGAQLSALEVPMTWHLVALAVVMVAGLFIATSRFLPESLAHAASTSSESSPGDAGRSANTTKQRNPWTEPRTLLVGLVVLGAALTEGAANDWMAKATVDGLHQEEWMGALIFAIFVAAMTLFRFAGGGLTDRWGRMVMLYSSLAAALLGLVVFVLGDSVWIAALGAILWGAGAAMGFPTGMSAAADDPIRAAKRVSVVSTIGYLAFLGGPPLIGFLADHWGLRPALLVIGVVMLASIAVVPAARPLKPVIPVEDARVHP
ncbi:MFS transporter [Psychromicrobium xiongbiense]|uniref:MFS transporter n=1 Tax=Psychromicrobium xiongbiense TaxID=3051184 RepID=UPI0025523D0E|nr:MFS transporter [Psychromicrobium sp. YIM S02556]